MRYVLMTFVGPDHVEAWDRTTPEERQLEIDRTIAWFREHGRPAHRGRRGARLPASGPDRAPARRHRRAVHRDQGAARWLHRARRARRGDGARDRGRAGPVSAATLESDRGAVLDRLEPEAVAVAHEPADRVRRARATGRSSQSSSAAWANSSALRATESSGKSSNAVTQRGFAPHGRMNRSPKNASGPRAVAGAAHDDRLVARSSGRRSGRPTRPA